MQLQPVTAPYIFEVKLLTYANPRGTARSTRINCDIIGGCDTYFLFCLRKYETPSKSHRDMCGSPRLRSRVFQGNNINFMSLTDIGELESEVLNPLVFTGDAWPAVSITV